MTHNYVSIAFRLLKRLVAADGFRSVPQALKGVSIAFRLLKRLVVVEGKWRIGCYIKGSQLPFGC